jgi:hypothetical protein
VVFGSSGKESQKSRRRRSTLTRPQIQNGSFSGREDNPEWVQQTRIQVQVEQGKKAIADLCQEMTSFLPAEDTHISEEEELIDYILRAVRICRMLMHENDSVNDAKARVLQQVGIVEHEWMRKLEEKDDVVAAAIAERDNMKYEHYNDTRGLREETAALKVERTQLTEKIRSLEYDNSVIRKKLDAVETKLLEIPRVEEQVFKRARAEIKSKEISLNKRECKWKRYLLYHY